MWGSLSQLALQRNRTGLAVSQYLVGIKVLLKSSNPVLHLSWHVPIPKVTSKFACYTTWSPWTTAPITNHMHCKLIIHHAYMFSIRPTLIKHPFDRAFCLLIIQSLPAFWPWSWLSIWICLNYSTVHMSIHVPSIGRIFLRGKENITPSLTSKWSKLTRKNSVIHLVTQLTPTVLLVSLKYKAHHIPCSWQLVLT